MLESKIIIRVIVLGLTLIFGFVLTKLGKPYNTGLFTVHKLLALAFVVMTFLQVKGLDVSSGSGSSGISQLLIVLIIVLVLSIIGIFATGAMMSIGGFNHNLLRIIHVITMSTLVASFGLLVLTFKL